MTEQPPPPPPGDYPPPPPGGYPPPPPPAGGFAPPPPGYPDVEPIAPLPKSAYTSWFTRVLAFLIDAVPVLILQGIGYGLLLGTRETVCLAETSEYDLGAFCATGASTLGQVAVAVCGLLALAYYVWNYGYRQGTTGSSIGKAIMGFRIVGEASGRPIGFGMSLLRQLIYLVANVICFLPWLVAVLFPLWDPKAQTLVDKIAKTVALPGR
ncbi:MAG: RDD family protein [Mycolicibacterium neoaurum]|uniref:RDD family protein n=1 Tax=Mycolicibacterium neoaurum TaxID=1795 RepID=UPI002FFB76D1